LNNYGVFLLGRRQFDGAESMFRRAIAEYETIPATEQIALPLVNLGELLSRREDRADLDAAQALFERAMAVTVTVYGHESFAVAYALADLGDVARRKGDLPRARALLEESLRLYSHTMPADHYEVVAPLLYLGETLLDLHQPSQALEYLERALRISEQSKGPDHPIAEILVGIASARAQLQELPEAQAAAERALALQRASLPADHYSLVRTLTVLGQVLAARDRQAEGRSRLEEAVRIARAGLPPANASRREAEAALAAVHGSMDRW
jgi:Tfp pilus assembly protein PilF